MLELSGEGRALLSQAAATNVDLFFACFKEGCKTETSVVLPEVGTKTREQLLWSTTELSVRNWKHFVPCLAFNTSYYQLTFQMKSQPRLKKPEIWGSSGCDLVLGFIIPFLPPNHPLQPPPGLCAVSSQLAVTQISAVWDAASQIPHGQKGNIYLQLDIY